MYNKAILIGNLTKDPELKYTPQGTAVCNFRLAVNQKMKSQGEAKEEVLFIGVVVFGKQAETVSQYLAKGRQVLVEGRLHESRWEADGQQKSRMEIIADRVRFLSKGQAADNGGSSAEADVPEAVTDLEPF